MFMTRHPFRPCKVNQREFTELLIVFGDKELHYSMRSTRHLITFSLLCDSIARPQFYQVHHFLLILHQYFGEIVDNCTSNWIFANLELRFRLLYKQVFDLFVVNLEVTHNQSMSLPQFFQFLNEETYCLVNKAS